MLAQSAAEIPAAPGYLFEPKWDGFRAIVFKQRGTVHLQSRTLTLLDRYFPELCEALAAQLPDDCTLDGEIVIATPQGLDFDALQQRLHPAASRVTRLATETPASFVAFDLLRLDGEDQTALPQSERRMLLESLLVPAHPPLHLTPMTTDRSQATRWLRAFQGAGLDGVVAKPADQPYVQGKRVMLKIKHTRTADCVVAGFRWHASGNDTIASLLLGLYDDAGVLQHVGSTSSFSMAERRALARELQPLRVEAWERHPWATWAAQHGGSDAQRMPGAPSRWSSGKEMPWEPLRIQRVCEVKVDQLQGRRFRHTASFLRWRFDKPPADCTFEQLSVAPPYELARVFAS
jgi:ATP-dependent DNA ligase